MVIILSSLCLLISFVFLQNYIASLEYNACDISVVNDSYKIIEKELKTETIDVVEAKYTCSIILKKETNYSNELYTAMKNGNVMMDYLEGDTLIGKIIFPTNSDSFATLKRNLAIALWVVFIIVILILYIVVFVIYVRILRPFRKLTHFADNISVGNLDIPLTMDKINYFGAFTESFDMMREELKKARQGEYDANISKKELVAGLSHDIKTPVATIKALCEILEIKLKDEEIITKIRTINQKSDVIDTLISDMFHATLEELEALKIQPREEFSTILPTIFSDINHYGRIHNRNEVPGCLIYCDKLRLNQVIDNIINNSYKYAESDIDIIYSENQKYIVIEIRDFGTSNPEGDIPLVFEKFYRGENATTHSGSGLGLYLAKQFMKGMEGEIECFVDKGFVVILTVKKV